MQSKACAGKTTLVNLLLRFHDLEAGRILIDGQDIAGVTQESLRAAIGMVTQDTALLHRSIRDTIRYGWRSGATVAMPASERASPAASSGSTRSAALEERGGEAGNAGRLVQADKGIGAKWAEQFRS